jgi:hypothetical protein
MSTTYVRDHQGRPVGLDWTVHSDGRSDGDLQVVAERQSTGEVKVKMKRTPKSRRKPPEEHKPMGRPPQETCSQGHDMAKHGRQIFTRDGRKNGRECTECKRERQRVGAFQ